MQTLTMALLLAARSARSFVARAPAVRPPSARAMTSSGSYDMEGTISKIGEVQTFESGFAKIEFVVTTEEMYPQEVKFAPRPRLAARVFRRGFRRGGETRAAAASASPRRRISSRTRSACSIPTPSTTGSACPSTSAATSGRAATT